MMGEALAPSPFVPTALLIAFVFTEYSPDPDRKDWLPASTSSRKFASAKIGLRAALGYELHFAVLETRRNQ